MRPELAGRRCDVPTCTRPESQRRGGGPLDGLCHVCRKRAKDRDERIAARAAERAARDPLPPATCVVVVEAHRPYEIRVVGELTREGWERVGDALSERVGLPLTQLDLREVAHARPMSARVASFLVALLRSGSRVIVYCSRYVQACILASRFGTATTIEWRIS